MNSSNGALGMLTHTRSKRSTVHAEAQDHTLFATFWAPWEWEPWTVDLGIKILRMAPYPVAAFRTVHVHWIH